MPADPKRTLFEEMVQKLKSYGPHHGYAELGNVAIVVGPGAPFSVYTTDYTTDNLREAREQGLFTWHKLRGGIEVDICVPRGQH
jgi:hypothetical protein